MNSKIKIAVNGLGRIGKLVVRAVFERQLTDKIDICFINSPSTTENKAYSIKYDTAHRAFMHNVHMINDNTIDIDGMHINAYSKTLIESIDCSDIDVLFECSGKMKNKGIDFIKQGAKYVLISAPASHVDQTLIYGVNTINQDARIISMGSCTTNALAVLLDMIMTKYNGLNDIIGCNMVTIHSYTGDQRILDGSHQDLYRGRAAASSIVPTTTGAQSTIKKVLPNFHAGIICSAYRVPTINVSLIDLYIALNQCASIQEINELAKNYAAKSTVMDFNSDKLVSSDFNHNDKSCVFDANMTNVNDNFLHIGGWYDNEWGFANRMIDAALDVCSMNA